MIMWAWPRDLTLYGETIDAEATRFETTTQLGYVRWGTNRTYGSSICTVYGMCYHSTFKQS